MREPLRGYGQQFHHRGDKRELSWDKSFKNLQEGSVMRRWLIWDKRPVWDWNDIQFNWCCLIPTWGLSQPWCSWANLSTSQLQGASRCRAGKSLFLRFPTPNSTCRCASSGRRWWTTGGCTSSSPRRSAPGRSTSASPGLPSRNSSEMSDEEGLERRTNLDSPPELHFWIYKHDTHSCPLDLISFIHGRSRQKTCIVKSIYRAYLEKIWKWWEI